MLFGLVCLTFVIANVAPSDPAALAAGPDAGRSQIEQARRDYGLDKPLPEQFLRYVTELAQGNFGRSIATGRPVGTDLARLRSEAPAGLAARFSSDMSGIQRLSSSQLL